MESQQDRSSLALEVTKVIEIDAHLSLDEEEPLLGDWMCGLLKPSNNSTRNEYKIVIEYLCS